MVEDGTKKTKIMMHNFSASGNPLFKDPVFFLRADSKSKGKGKSTIHFNGSDETIEVILRTVISVNHLTTCAEL